MNKKIIKRSLRFRMLRIFAKLRPLWKDKKLELFITKYSLFFFLSIAITSLIISLKIFDVRVSLSGDDSGNILQGINFIKSFKFPSFQGPLYPIVIGFLYALFGFKLVIFKAFSIFCLLGFMLLSYLGLHKRVPMIVLLPSFLLIGICTPVLYFTSQTYAEMFLMFWQSLVIVVFFNYFVDTQGTSFVDDFKTSIKKHLILALVILLAALTRTVGYYMFGCVLVYFLCYKEWKNLLRFVASFVFVYVVYSLVKMALWHANGLDFSSQGSTLSMVNPYNSSLGKEHLFGYLVRFWGNSKQYLSAGLLGILGIKCENNILYSLFIYAMIIVTLVFSYKKNKYLFFICLLVGSFLSLTFVSLQVFWNQSRLIIPIVFYILIALLGCIYFVLHRIHRKSIGFMFIPVLILLVLGVKNAQKDIDSAKKITSIYSGIPINWVNYIKAGKWASENLGTTAFVVCRKASIPTVYSNRQMFYGIPVVPQTDFNPILASWNANKNEYLALSNFKDANLSIHYNLSPYYVGHLIINSKVEYLLVKNDSRVTKLLDLNHIKAYSYADIIPSDPKANSYAFFVADSLLANLKNAHVTHLMLSSLGPTTIPRYASYVSEKYPYIWKKVHQEGKEYSTTIYEILWQRIPQ